MQPTYQLQRGVRALYRISETLTAGRDTQVVLDTVLERIVEDLGYRAATLRLLDDEQQTLTLQGAYGLSTTYVSKGTVEVAHSALDREALSGAVAAVADVRHDPGFQYPAAAADEGLVSALVLPLALRERAIGVLRVYTATPHTFDAEEQDLLTALASLGAQAIQRARLVTAYQQMAQSLTASLDLTAILTTLLLQSTRELQVRAGSIRLLGPRGETLHLAAAAGLSEAYLAKGAVKVAQSPVDQHVLTTLQPVAITELSAEAGFQYPAEAQREGIRSVLVAPLRVHDRATGVLRIYAAQLRRFSTEEIGFVCTVADLGALAIENAKLHELLKARLEALQADSNAWQRFLSFS